MVGPSGVIGRKHVREVAASTNARLVAIHDVNAEVADQQAAELATRSYPALDDLLGDPEVDAITIATPHPSHLPIALQAFAAGKHVLTEKPIAATPSEADEMVKAARDRRDSSWASCSRTAFAPRPYASARWSKKGRWASSTGPL